MSRLKACPCGRHWHVNRTRPTFDTCATCRREARAVAAAPRHRLPTLAEWRQLATDNEVRAGHAAWARGVRDPLTAAMADEHRARVRT